MARSAAPACVADPTPALERALALLGGRWSLLVLWHLRRGPARPAELRRKLPAVSQRMLTLRLRELADNGLIHREGGDAYPLRVEYRLTPLGRSLAPVMKVLCRWALALPPESATRRRRFAGAGGDA